MLSTKIKEKLYKKAYTIGTILIFFAGCFTWVSRPVTFFYQQKEGILVDVFDTVSSQNNSPRTRRHNYRNVPVYLFYIDNDIYRIEHSGKENKIKKFENIINKKIQFRYDIARFSFYSLREFFSYNKNSGKFVWHYASTKQKRKIIYEIICDGEIIYLNEHLSVFCISLALFILSLSWIAWAFIKYLKKPAKRNKLKDDEEECFLENCKIQKLDNKYFLYYVSKLDNRTIKAIEITEAEFLSAKNGNMNLENFCSTYNLW
jgi:hypothetical protein